jgi:hypothetical protein
MAYSGTSIDIYMLVLSQRSFLDHPKDTVQFIRTKLPLVYIFQSLLQHFPLLVTVAAK